MMSKTILIADDHPLFRHGVRSKLESAEEFNIIAEAGDGEEALRLIEALKPDAAVLDFQMPGLSGLEIARRLNGSGLSSTKIVLLTMYHDKKIFCSAIEAGVQGYVLKDDAVNNIIKAVRDVLNGRHFISSELSELLIEKAMNNTEEKRSLKLISTLTPAERKILLLVSELKTNEDISVCLSITKRTVENHKVHITEKLMLSSSRDLLKFSLENKDLLS